MKYRVFVTIEEEDPDQDTFTTIDETCLQEFDVLEDAQDLMTRVENAYVAKI